MPEKATGADVLVAAGATLRQDKALTCAIDGWPVTGCGDPVDPVPAAAAVPDASITIAAPAASAVAAPAAQPQDAATIGAREVALGLAAVLLIAALGFAAWRRGREASDG